MSEHVDPETGEVVDAPLGVVPLNLAAMDDDELAQALPTPQQAHAALAYARTVNARIPAGLAQYRERLQQAERDLSLAVAFEVMSLREEFPKSTLTELKGFAYSSDSVKQASDSRDTAWLAFEYAKDWAETIREDIQILRSINKNLREGA